MNIGFSASIFDFTSLSSDTTNINLNSAVTIRDDILGEIYEETQFSSLVKSIETFLVTRATSQGFILEFEVAGQEFPVTNPKVNADMYHIWEAEVKKMIVHSIRYGFCAVRYVERYKSDISENRFIPRVMDPISEYTLKMVTNPDGTREYYAFPRTSVEIIKRDPIKPSRVFIFDEPESDGSPTSPMMKCLGDLQKLRSYWERNQKVDFKLANPNHIYQITGGKESGIIPNVVPQEAVADYENTVMNDIGIRPSERQIEVMYGNAATNRFIWDQMKSSKDHTIDLTETKDGAQRGWNSQLRTFTNVPMQDTFLPERLLPQNVTLTTGPRPQPLPNFQGIIEDLIRSITNCNGIPAEVILGSGRYAANAQFAEQQINTTVQGIQRSLEKVIVQMYLDIYIDDHLEWVTIVVKKSESLRNKLKQEEEKRVNTDSNEKDEDGEHTISFDKKKDRKEDDVESVNSDNNNNAVKIVTKTTHKRTIEDTLFSEESRAELEKRLIVKVHFNYNPTSDFATLQKLRDENIINHKTFQILALASQGLPQSMAMTEDEIKEKEKKQISEAPIQQPTGDSSTKRKIGTDGPNKKQKTLNENPLKKTK